MKFPFLLILLSCGAAGAQTNALPNPESVRLRAEFIMKWRPFKVVGQRLYDFTPLFVAYANHTDTKRFSFYIIAGDVLQVNKDGLLINVKKWDEVIHLINCKEQSTAIDGQTINYVAVDVGRYQYINTQGSVKTIGEYDCGHSLDLSTNRFKEKLLVLGEEEKTLTIPNLDLGAFAYILALTNKPGPPAPR